MKITVSKDVKYKTLKNYRMMQLLYVQSISIQFTMRRDESRLFKIKQVFNELPSFILAYYIIRLDLSYH